MAANIYETFNAFTNSYGGGASATPSMFGDAYAGGGGTTLDAGTAAAANTPVPGTTSTGDISTAWQDYLDNLAKQNLGTEGGFFTKNADMLSFGIDAVGTLAKIWQTYEATKLAKEQFKAEKEAANINIANQIMAYNTALQDKTRHRASFNELSPEETNTYLASHELQKRQIA